MLSVERAVPRARPRTAHPSAASRSKRMRPSCPELPTMRALLTLAEGAPPRLVGAARSSFDTTREFGFRPGQHEECFSRRKEGGRSKAVLEASAFRSGRLATGGDAPIHSLEQRTGDDQAHTPDNLRRRTHIECPPVTPKDSRGEQIARRGSSGCFSRWSLQARAPAGSRRGFSATRIALPSYRISTRCGRELQPC